MKSCYALASCAVIFGFACGYPDQSDTPDMDALIRLHNEARISSVRSPAPLVRDEKLMQYAKDHAKWMAEHGRMRHSPMSGIMQLGFSTAGENIAWGQRDEASVMSVWMRSAGHRANILSSRYTAIGCGAESRDGRLYWCACFGRPRSEGADESLQVVNADTPVRSD